MTKSVTTKDLLLHDYTEFDNVASMLSKTVHDVNNPLAVFIGQLSIIDLLIKKDKLTPEKLEKIITRFKSSTETFSTRLGYIQNYYKVISNDSMFDYLHQTMEAVVYHFENLAYKGGINLNCSLEEVEGFKDIKLAIPSAQLFIITKHLVQNSIDSIILKNANSETGGNIDIDFKVSPTEVIISVTDDGPGLICDIDMACELGYSTKNSNHPGYGLSAVKELVEQNNLKFSYKKDKKCCFTVIYKKKAQEKPAE